jgi:2-keto-3-deoxy-L-rhamnonate aldolase RhmA
MHEIGKVGDTHLRSHKNLKEMIACGQTPIGMCIALASPYMAEIAAIAGFDFVYIDMEHNLFNVETVCNIIRAADSCGLPTTARIVLPELITPLLDFGMAGFKIPHVRSAAQAKALVDMVKYAPMGRRGFCTAGRAQRFGAMPFGDYVKEIGDEATLTIMIEDAEGIEHMEEILAVPGIDFLNVGAGDLTQALGHLGETEHPEVQAMVKRICAVADKYGVKYPGNGAPLVIAEDKSVLLEGMSKVVSEYRNK